MKFTYLTIGVLGISCGALVGWLRVQDHTPILVSNQECVSASRKSVSQTQSRVSKRIEKSYSGLKKYMNLNNRLMPLDRELERMSLKELQDMVLLIACEPKDGVSEDERVDAFSLVLQLLNQIYKRDGETALTWLERLQIDQIIKDDLLSGLGAIHVKENPIAGKSWVDQHRVAKGDEWAKRFVHSAIAGATGRSAEELIEVFHLYKDDMGGIGFPQGAYAEDFDFVTLFSGLSQSVDLSSAVLYWAAKDRDAASKAVSDLALKEPRMAKYYGQLFHAANKLHGTEEASRWVAETIGKLPEGMVRSSAIESLGHYPDSRKTEVFASLLDHMPTESDRVTYAKSIVSPFINKSTQAAEILKRLPSAGLRSKLLMETTKTYRPVVSRKGPNADEVIHYYEELAGHLGMSAEESSMLVDSLKQR